MTLPTPSQRVSTLSSQIYQQEPILYSDKEIFSLIFGFLPKEGDFALSPFRHDQGADCYFFKWKGKLLFIDWGDTHTHRNAHQCISEFFGVDETLVEAFTKSKGDKGEIPLLNGNSPVKGKKRGKCKGGAEILTSPIPFTETALQYWSQYEITEENLKEDFVIQTKKIIIKEKGTGNLKIKQVFLDLCFLFTMPSGTKKLYFPKRDKGGRHRTNVTQDDIGGVFNKEGGSILISKSYKDYRVLKNQGFNTCFFQNEGNLPSYESLDLNFKSIENIDVLFDNDGAGIRATKKVKKHIQQCFPDKTVRGFQIPHDLLKEGISDPSDYIKVYGGSKLKKLLNNLL